MKDDCLKQYSTKAEESVNNFKHGLNCAQSVFIPHAPLLGLSKEKAMKLTEAFGGGMGIAETCGVVTGALMAIGLKFGRSNSEDIHKKKKTSQMTSQFLEEFSSQHHNTTCKGLLGVDKSTEEGNIISQEKNFSKTLCTIFVRDASSILEQLINQ